MNKLPLTNIKKFKTIDATSLMKLDLCGKNYECFMCYGDKHNATNQQIDHRYRKDSFYEGIELHWGDNIFSIGWDDNYTITHE